MYPIYGHPPFIQWVYEARNITGGPFGPWLTYWATLHRPILQVVHMAYAWLLCQTMQRSSEIHYDCSNVPWKTLSSSPWYPMIQWTSLDRFSDRSESLSPWGLPGIQVETFKPFELSTILWPGDTVRAHHGWSPLRIDATVLPQRGAIEKHGDSDHRKVYGGFLKWE